MAAEKRRSSRRGATSQLERPERSERWWRARRVGQLLTSRQTSLKPREWSGGICGHRNPWSRAEAAGMAGGQMGSGARGEGTYRRE